MNANVTHLYTGSDGESHFEDMKITLMDYEGLFYQSEQIRAKWIVFQDTGDRSGGHDWHNAPRRQLLIPLAGHTEIEIGDGTKRVLGPGDILLAEDTTGRGHITRNHNSMPNRALVIALE